MLMTITHYNHCLVRWNSNALKAISLSLFMLELKTKQNIRRLARIAKDLLCCVDKIHLLILLRLAVLHKEAAWPLIVNALVIVMGTVVLVVASLVLLFLELGLIVTVADL